MRRPIAIALAAITLATPAAAQTLDIREWPVPWEDTRPRDPYVDAQNHVWFVGQTGHYIGMLDPATGEFERYDLEDGAGPHNLIVAEDGAVWYAGNRAAHIGQLDPATGAIHKIAMPDAAARDPHTLVFDDNGDIWFTVQGGNYIGKLDVETEQVRLIESQTADSRPYGIVIDDSGRPWVNLFGTNKLATIDPQTFELREITLQHADARTRRIGLTSDGAVWYVDYARGFLGRLDPRTDAVEEWPMPSGTSSRPYAMAVDAQDRIWAVETGVEPNLIVGFDPETRTFFSSTAIPSGGGTVRHMVFHEPTNTIWFGADTGTIGRVVLP
ncbi:MAG: virginiamycin B lyase family protein [Longimicrobiales bacterium]